MMATTPALASSRRRGSGRQPWLCAQSIPARPRHARTSPVYSATETRTVCDWSDGSRLDNGSLRFGNVSVFGAVAPTSIPSSSPAAEMLTAIRGSESLLQESLRMTVLMTQSIGPVGGWLTGTAVNWVPASRAPWPLAARSAASVWQEGSADASAVAAVPLASGPGDMLAISLAVTVVAGLAERSGSAIGCAPTLPSRAPAYIRPAGIRGSRVAYRASTWHPIGCSSKS